MLYQEVVQILREGNFIFVNYNFYKSKKFIFYLIRRLKFCHS